ncbi:MAG: hypothetical protein FJ096_12860 [Deltaproteobacteria bacterium]|nr:hypothetical protein [Deltaproteobacteria bacterium]
MLALGGSARALGAVALGLTLVTCQAKGDGSATLASAVTTAAGAEPSGFRIDGEPFTPAALLAVGTEGESSWRITVARGPLDCEGVVAAYPEHPAGAGNIDLWFSAPLGTDGQATEWSYRSGFELGDGGTSGRGLVARGAMLKEVVDEGDAVLVRGLEVSLQSRGPNGHLVQFDGELRAKRCGRVALKEAPRPQPGLKLTIGGQPVAIGGATLRSEGARRYLRLTRAPHRCDSAFTEGYDFYVDLALGGEPLAVVLVALLGDAFPESATGSRGKESFVVRAPTLADEKRDVRIALKGSLDAGGYAVTFDGDVDALRCTTPPSPTGASSGAPPVAPPRSGP